MRTKMTDQGIIQPLDTLWPDATEELNWSQVLGTGRSDCVVNASILWEMSKCQHSSHKRLMFYFNNT